MDTDNIELVTSSSNPMQVISDQFLDQFIQTHGVHEVYKVIAKLAGYQKTPPDIDTFLDDSDYLGHHSIQVGQGIWPYWRGKLRAIYPNPFDSPYMHIIISGAIGIGKSTMAKVGAAYDILRMAYLKNPQKTYGLLPTTTLVYQILNVTMTAARTVLYDELVEWFLNSPEFRRMIETASTGRSGGTKTLFPNRIDLASGSRASHALGRAVFGAILDELNFQDKVRNQAWDNYNNILRRMQSRFQRGSKIPGHLWLISSKREETDMLQRFIDSSRGDPTTLIIEDALWKVKPNLGLSGKTFKVYVGDTTKDPFIIDDSKKYPGQFFRLDESRIIDVPIEFYDSFKKDIYKSLQDLAGVSTTGIHRFLPSVELINQSCTKSNPVMKQVVELSFYDEDDQLIKYLEPGFLRRVISPDSPRFIHIDLGLVNDKTGISSVFIVDWIEVKRTNPITGETTVELEPLFAQDFLFVIKSHHGEEVPIYKIRDFITDLGRAGYPIHQVTTDGYQSTQLRQELRIRGFETALLSVDRTKEPYEVLKRSIYERRLIAIDSEILKKELRELIDVGKKIDHPEGGSKDAADSLAGALYAASSARLGPMRVFNEDVSFEQLLAEIDEEIDDEIMGDVLWS